MPRVAPNLESLEARIVRLERETRLLKRACALLLALLAAGIFILQGMLHRHIEAPADSHMPRGNSETHPEAPATDESR